MSRMPDRNPRSRQEASLVVSILITAVVIGAAVAILPTLGRATPEEEAAAAQYLKAQKMESQDPAKAMELYASIPPEAREWRMRAAVQIGRLQAEEARKPPKPSAQELADYEEFLGYWRSHAGDHEELIRRGEAFVMAHPRGEKRPDVEERIAHARTGRAAQREKEAAATEEAVDRFLARNDFGGAVLAIEKVSDSLRPELNVWRRLSAKRDAAVAQARRHYLKQIEESDRLVKEGLHDDARRLWFACIRGFGDGKVPELADLHRAAELRLGEIKP
jgi:hypothetical protein